MLRTHRMSQALMLSFVVFLAITISCCFSGVAGAMVPLVMKKLGADPAMASGIVVTAFADVGCLLVFLWAGCRTDLKAVAITARGIRWSYYPRCVINRAV